MNVSKNKPDIEQYAAITEPVFYFGLEKNKSIPRSMEPLRLKNYFEYTLKQNPENLACHLQRIKFSLQQNNQNEIFAALCDLFIILDQQGQALRQRLFDYVQDKLSPEQIELLAKHLNDNGLNNGLNNDLSNASEACSEHCLFKQQETHLFELETQIDSASDTAAPESIEDSVQAIESYIEHSQFDMAEEYLIKLLNNDPENEALTIKAISLYKALDSFALFNQAYLQFSNCLLTSRHWEEAHHYFLEKSQ